MKNWIKRTFMENGEAEKENGTTENKFGWIDSWIEDNQAYSEIKKGKLVWSMRITFAFLGIILLYVFGTMFSVQSTLLGVPHMLTQAEIDNYLVYRESFNGLINVAGVVVVLTFALYFGRGRLLKDKHEGTRWATVDLFTQDGVEREFHIDLMSSEPEPIKLSESRLREQMKEAQKGQTKEKKEEIEAEYAPFFDKKHPISCFRWFRADMKFVVYLVARDPNLNNVRRWRAVKHYLGCGSKKLEHASWNVLDMSPYVEVSPGPVAYMCQKCGEEIPRNKVDGNKAICLNCSWGGNGNGTGKKGWYYRHANKPTLVTVKRTPTILTSEIPFWYITDMPKHAPQWIPTVSQNIIIQKVISEPSLADSIMEVGQVKVSNEELLNRMEEEKHRRNLALVPHVTEVVQTTGAPPKEETSNQEGKKFNKWKIITAIATVLAGVALVMGVL